MASMDASMPKCSVTSWLTSAPTPTKSNPCTMPLARTAVRAGAGSAATCAAGCCARAGAAWAAKIADTTPMIVLFMLLGRASPMPVGRRRRGPGNARSCVLVPAARCRILTGGDLRRLSPDAALGVVLAVEAQHLLLAVDQRD